MLSVEICVGGNPTPIPPAPPQPGDPPFRPPGDPVPPPVPGPGQPEPGRPDPGQPKSSHYCLIAAPVFAPPPLSGSTGAPSFSAAS